MMNSLAAYNPYSNTQASNNAQKSLTVTISPSEDNVNSGDKSNNSAEIVAETSKNSYTKTVKRDDAVSQVEQQLKQNVAKNALNIDDPNMGRTKSKVIAHTVNNNEFENDELRETTTDLYQTKNSYQTAQYAIDVFADASSDNDDDPYNTSQNESNNSDFVTLHNKATDAYIKHSMVDAIGNKINQTV